MNYSKEYEQCKTAVLGGVSFQELADMIDNQEIHGKEIVEEIRWLLKTIDTQAKTINVITELR